MRTGICPKCGSATVHTAVDGLDGGPHAVLGRFRSLIPAQCHDYVCVTCGYVEQYLSTDGKAMERIVQTWQRVLPQDRAAVRGDAQP